MAADPRPGVDLDPGQEPAEMGQEAAEQPPVAHPEPMSQAVNHQGLETWIGQHHFQARSEEHTSELQSLMRLSYAVFCLKKKKTQDIKPYRQCQPILIRATTNTPEHKHT